MIARSTRRTILKSAGIGFGSGMTGAGGLSFLAQLPKITRADTQIDPNRVQLRSEIEPLVRLLEDTSREKLLEEVGHRIRRGLSYQDILAALLLAGVRNIQPRPVGFKFHAVLVVNSAHLASLSAPDGERWLPLFWALDYFKSSQARDIQEGDWTMAPVDEARVPAPHLAREAFVRAMDDWDLAAADAAVAGLARGVGANEIFDLFCRYGARDFRDIGHKAIYVANAWRTLQVIGWHHAEPVLRSLAYALLDHEGDSPAKRDAPADLPGRENLLRLKEFPKGWRGGLRDEAAAADFLETLREGDATAASVQVVTLLEEGVHPASLWQAQFEAAAEWLMRRPGIVALHAVTCTNAMHFSFHHTGDEETRRLLLLQNAAFLPLFRGDPETLREPRLDRLDAAEIPDGNGEALEQIFTTINQDRLAASGQTLAWLNRGGEAKEFVDMARRMVFLKGINSHDYKFSSAVLEDYLHLPPGSRDRFLAASVYNLRGSGGADNDLVGRIREAISG